MIRTDGNGNRIWDKTFGGNKSDWANSVQQTKDGGYIIGGWTESFGSGGKDVLLIKIDAQGNETWNKTFGGNRTDSCNDARQTIDGGYILTGDTYSYNSHKGDVWLIKTDMDGEKIWDMIFGGLTATHHN